MIMVVAFALLGVLLGIFTGLVPGIHVNTVAAILIGLSACADPMLFAVIVMSTAITHTIWDFVPSILLGAPEAGTSLSVLPGHSMLLEGRGQEAIYLTVVGGVCSAVLSVAMLPVLFILIPLFYHSVQVYMHWLLGGMAAFMVLTESGVRKAFAIVCFTLSGILGVIILDSFMISSHEAFLPLFTGLFGVSTLLISLRGASIVPRQAATMPVIHGSSAVLASLKSIISGVIVGTLPGVGSSQAAVLVQNVTKTKDREGFLMALGGINTVVAMFSLLSLYVISRARSGAAVAVQQLLPGFAFDEMVLLVGVALFSVGISSAFLLSVIRRLVSFMQGMDYKKLTLSVIIMLFGLNLLLSGLPGILILAVSTSIGLIAPLSGVKRSNLMGVLMLPLIIFYAGM